MDHHVADVVLVKDQTVLLVQQRKPSAYGLWSYPGGTIEPSETPKQALIREVKEEVGAELTWFKPLGLYEVKYPNTTVVVHSYIGEIKEPVNLYEKELMSWGWYSIADMMAMSECLRSTVIIKQAKDALRATHKQHGI